MSVWLALALQTVPAPAWFPEVCAQAPEPGVALVEVRSRPQQVGPLRTVYFDAAGYPGLQADDYVELLALTPGEPVVEAAGRVWHPLPGEVMPWRFDACQQVLWIAPRRLPQKLDFAARPALPLAPAQPSLRGNVDVFASRRSGGPEQLAGLVDLAGSGDWGRLQSAWVLNEGVGAQRLESVFIRDQPDQLTQLRLGDSLLRADALGTAVRFAGLQWGTEFGLDPEQTPFPLPALRGEAALPSTLELFIDGTRVRSGEVDAGTFDVVDIPAFSGAGELQVVVRDALGRATVYAQPFYVSTQLLREGLSDYSLALGFLRLGFAGSSDEYDRAPFSVLRWRRGLRPDLTAGLRLEAQAGAQTGGLSLAKAWPEIGVLEVALAASENPDGSGGMARLGYERLTSRLSLRLGAGWRSPRFEELGREAGAIAESYRAQVGVPGPWGSSLSLARVVERRRDREDLGLTALNLGLPLPNRAFASLSVLESSPTGIQGTLTFSLALGQRRSGLLQLTQAAAEQPRLRAGYQQGREGSLGWQYRVSAERQAFTTAQLSLDYGGRRGDVLMDVTEQDGAQAFTVSARTGLSLTGRALYWSRPLRESYAVVETGEAGVTVYADHREVAVTGASGRAVVPELRPYQTIRLGIDHQDLPLDRELTAATSTLRPRPGATRIDLAGRAVVHHRYRLRQVNGDWVPAGSALSLNGKRAELPVGYEGLVWLPPPTRAMGLDLRWQGGHCRVRLPPGTAEGETLTCSPP